MDPDPLCLGRFSRWVRKVIRCPAVGSDPFGYLDAVASRLRATRYDVLLPTHEQAYLFATARSELPPAAGLAVAERAAFDRVQSKVAFAQLLRELGLPQPDFRVIEGLGELANLSYPYWLKTAFSTAGRGVWRVGSQRDRDLALGALSRGQVPYGGLLAQAPASGTYGQVQALFDRGRMIAVHTCVATATGMGGSAAARLSVEHREPRVHVGRLGEALAWHGGLTLDYLWDDRDGPRYIECNPRTVEPGNAVASGVHLPALQVRLSLGERFDGPPITGRPGVRTHSFVAICMGAADRSGRRRDVLAQLRARLRRSGPFHDSLEILTPLPRDPPSAIPLAFVLARLLARPAAAATISFHAVGGYSLSGDAVERLAAPRI